jgi:tRNA pseudouridine55 synthase
VQRVTDVLPQFVGDIQQAPPTFSAIRVHGKRAYQLAREGKKVELEKRRVRIHSIDVLGVQGTRLTLKIRCSKGTYIRSLARDLGRALDTVAFVRKLTRTRIGDYRLENAESLDQLESRLTIKNQKTG